MAVGRSYGDSFPFILFKWIRNNYQYLSGYLKSTVQSDTVAVQSDTVAVKSTAATKEKGHRFPPDSESNNIAQGFCLLNWRLNA